ncbi:FAD/NAD(P)-binding domain-containing protein [Periconia macrospinosa]|uniref:FAD/NAD(P)-binding domain-containing protein n=1 Tax=Periconia macrospinosa TaxID=97972 RepID=A0A2V1EB12_9PLEO|nr:FAD/NAD(P)-binding domain-containing protein [Periconia macrospinosa]
MSTNGRINGDAAQPFLPIVVAGGGCVGLFLALLLTQSDIPNRVIVIEPFHPDATSTRAMAHQPLIFPLFERAGLMGDLAQAGTFSSGLCFRTSPRNGSKLIAGKVFREDDKAQMLLPQGKFQEILVQKVEDSGKGEVWWGWKVVGFDDQKEEVERASSVKVKIECGDEGRSEVIDAVYLVGADGAKSLVRKTLGLTFDGDTLSTALVATDIRYDFHKHGFYDANFVVDQQDYGLIGRIDTEGLWRVSYGVPAEATEKEIRSEVEERLRRMIPDGGDSEFEVKRIAPYKAQQRCVNRFWMGRVGVCGDAAHCEYSSAHPPIHNLDSTPRRSFLKVTNPYAGLGLASGIADASSLAPILVRILSGQATDEEKLLSSWSSARRQKFLTTVDKPSRAAYMRVMNNVSSEEEIQEFLEKDALVGSLNKGMPVVPPRLDTTVDELEGW